MVVGSKHRLMLGGRCTSSRKRGGKVYSSCATPRPKRPSVNPASTDQSHHCTVCDIDVNSEAQLQQVCVFINIKQNGILYHNMYKNFTFSSDFNWKGV